MSETEEPVGDGKVWPPAAKIRRPQQSLQYSIPLLSATRRYLPYALACLALVDLNQCALCFARYMRALDIFRFYQMWDVVDIAHFVADPIAGTMLDIWILVAIINIAESRESAFEIVKRMLAIFVPYVQLILGPSQLYRLFHESLSRSSREGNVARAKLALSLVVIFWLLAFCQTLSALLLQTIELIVRGGEFRDSWALLMSISKFCYGLDNLIWIPVVISVTKAQLAVRRIQQPSRQPRQIR